jgi:hypothetical protein
MKLRKKLLIGGAVAVVVACVNATVDDCVNTAAPTFLTFVPSVVPVVLKMFPALIGPEKVVFAISIFS